MATIVRRHLLSQSIKGAGVIAASTTFSPYVLAAPKPKKKLGVALLGLGTYSRGRLGPGLQLTEHCELKGIITGSPEKIPVWQEAYGIEDKNVYSYENMHTIVNNPDIDVVAIVVPTFLHKKYSLLAAQAGKHVWCEKPMAMTVSECQDIMDACNKNKVKLSIGYRMQHEPNTQTVMQFAKTKKFGDIKALTVHAAYAGRGKAADDWRMHRSKGGGAFYDMGVYCINGARYGSAMEPIAISARHQNNMPEKFIHTDDTTVFELTFANGMVANCMTSVTQAGNKLHAVCEKGEYLLEPMSRYSGVQGRASGGILLNKTVAHQQAKMMDDNALSILNKVPVLVPGEEGMRDIQVVEKGLLSASLGGKQVSLV